MSDHDEIDRLVSNDAGKVSYQAAIQKCKNIDEGKTQKKLDETNLKKNMNDWAKTASGHQKKEKKKL